MTTYTIDWLTMTFEGARNPVQLEQLAETLFMAPNTQTTKPSHGYKWAIKTDEGMVLQSGERHDMHTNVICSGGSISALSEVFPHSPEWLTNALRKARNVTRIDLAIDSHDKPYLADLVTLVRASAYKCAAQSYKVIDSGKSGLTLYLGERTSERMMRVYDKAAQMGETDTDWTRFELEVKGEAAKRCAASIIKDGIGQTVKAWIAAFADFPLMAYADMLADTKAVYVPSQRKLSSSREWYIRTIAPQIARRIRDGDLTIWQEMTAVIDALR